MQKCPGQRKPLALSAGKVGRFFGKRRIQHLFVFQKGGEVHLLQHGPELLVRRAGSAHLQILPDGAPEQIILAAHIGDVLQKACVADLPQLYAADGHGAGVALVPARQNAGYRGLSAAGFAHDGGQAAHGKFHIHAVQNFPFFFIRKAQP